MTSISFTAIFKFFICGVAFVSTFYTVAHLTFFLSNPSYNKRTTLLKDDALSVTGSLLINMGLLSLFIFQHSLMAQPAFKKTLSTYNIDDLQRTIYVIFTALALQATMSFWQIIPNITLWNFTLSNGPVWWTYLMIHTLCWLLIYIGSIFMDITELLGFKQVYYSVKNLPDPLQLKSLQLQKLYRNMRHPGFISFVVIFWCSPIMSLDRLLLSIILTAYMYLSWRTDINDYKYQHVQYERKYFKLSHLH